MTSPEVRGRVHQPGHVQREGVAQQGTGEESVPERLAEQPVGQEGGQHEATQHHQGQIISGGEKTMLLALQVKQGRRRGKLIKPHRQSKQVN